MVVHKHITYSSSMSLPKYVLIMFVSIWVMSSSIIGTGSSWLQYQDSQEVSNSWNIEHLRRFHPWSTGDTFYWCLEIDTTNIAPSYQFTTGTMRKFTKGASLPYSQYLIIRVRLVFWVSEGPLCSYFQYNSVLLVYDRYYVQVCGRGLCQTQEYGTVHIT
jgi:hypothetical protein